jgi:hypothetical protein
MADEQRFTISLSSALEVSNEDTVVNAQSPTFMANSQEELASLLSNSVKYERDGYFLGWNSYNFEMALRGDIVVEPDTLGEPVIAPLGDATYSVRFKGGIYMSVGFDGRIIQQIQGNVADPVRTGDTITFIGTTAIGNPVTVVIDLRDMTVVSCTLTDHDIQLTSARPFNFSASKRRSEDDYLMYRLQSEVSTDFIKKADKFRINSDLSQQWIYGTKNLVIPETGAWTLPSVLASVGSPTRTNVGTLDEEDRQQVKVDEQKVVDVGIQTDKQDWSFYRPVTIGLDPNNIVTSPVIGTSIQGSIVDYTSGPGELGVNEGQVIWTLKREPAWIAAMQLGLIIGDPEVRVSTITPGASSTKLTVDTVVVRNEDESDDVTAEGTWPTGKHLDDAAGYPISITYDADVNVPADPTVPDPTENTKTRSASTKGSAESFFTNSVFHPPKTKGIVYRQYGSSMMYYLYKYKVMDRYNLTAIDDFGQYTATKTSSPSGYSKGPGPDTMNVYWIDTKSGYRRYQQIDVDGYYGPDPFFVSFPGVHNGLAKGSPSKIGYLATISGQVTIETTRTKTKTWVPPVLGSASYVPYPQKTGDRFYNVSGSNIDVYTLSNKGAFGFPTLGVLMKDNDPGQTAGSGPAQMLAVETSTNQWKQLLYPPATTSVEYTENGQFIEHTFDDGTVTIYSKDAVAMTGYENLYVSVKQPDSTGTGPNLVFMYKTGSIYKPSVGLTTTGVTYTAYPKHTGPEFYYVSGNKINVLTLAATPVSGYTSYFTVTSTLYPGQTAIGTVTHLWKVSATEYKVPTLQTPTSKTTYAYVTTDVEAETSLEHLPLNKWSSIPPSLDNDSDPAPGFGTKPSKYKNGFAYELLTRVEDKSVTGLFWTFDKSGMQITSTCIDFIANEWQHEIAPLPGMSMLGGFGASSMPEFIPENTSRIPDQPAMSRKFFIALSLSVFPNNETINASYMDKIKLAPEGESKFRVMYQSREGYSLSAASSALVYTIVSDFDDDWNVDNFEIGPFYIDNKLPYYDIKFILSRGTDKAAITVKCDARYLRGTNFVTDVTIEQHGLEVVFASSSVPVKSTGSTADKQGTLRLRFKDDATYTLIYRRFLLIDKHGITSSFAVVDGEDSLINVDSDYGPIVLNFADGQVSITNDQVFIPSYDETTIFVTSRDNVEFSFVPSGLFNYNITPGNTTDRTFTFTHDDVEYTVTIPYGATSVLNITEKNMRKPMDKGRTIATLDSIGRLVLRSAWADSEVQRYFYVDSTTIFVVRYNVVQLLKKTDRLAVDQPWEWELLAEAPRDVWIIDEYPRWDASNAIDVIPIFYRVTATQTAIAIQFTELPTTQAGLDNPVWRTVTIPVNNLSYGSAPSSNAICMFEPKIEPSSILTLARFSSTRRGNYFLLGIWIAKSLKQWSVSINATTGALNGVLTGYGYVGIDGTVTGGQLPASECGMWGMRSRVMSLPDAKLDQYGCYGANDNIFFYYKQNESGIVTHWNFTGGGWSPVAIPLGLYSSHGKGSDSNMYLRMAPVAQLIFIMPAIGIAETITSRSWAYAWSAMSFWCNRNGMSDVDAFTEAAETRSEGAFNKFTTAMGYGLSGVGAVAGNLATESGLVPPSVTELALDTLDAVLGLDSFYTTTAGPWRFKISLNECYSIGNDSGVFAGPGFVQHQFVQAHYIGGGSGCQLRTSCKGFTVAAPLNIPGIQALGSGLGAGLTLMDGISGVYPFDAGPGGASDEMRIPAGRLGFRHLYLNYPSAAQSSTIEETHLKMTITDRKVTIRIMDALGADESVYLKYLKPVVENRTIHIPAGYAVVDGCHNILERADFLGVKRVEWPVISEAFVYDYRVHGGTDLWFSAVDGEIVYTSVADTKILDGAPTNVVVSGRQLFVASSYCALEVLEKGNFNLDLLRPRPVTSACLMWNTTEQNILYNSEVQHGFDAYSNRLISLRGAPGLDVEKLAVCFSYAVNGPLKVSSIFPPAAYFGLFTTAPIFDYSGEGWNHRIDVFLQDQISQTKLFVTLDALAENRNGYRFSVPVIHDRLALLPAAVKTIAAYKLHVVDGITSLTTDLRSTNGVLRRPRSLDFTVYGQIYRWNEEYISKINNAFGTSDIRDIVATLGLSYIGSTPEVAWFYSPAIRGFYNFSGSETIKKLFTAFRMYDVRMSTWDFVAQEVVMEADTNHGTMLARTSDNFTGEVYPIAKTIGPYDFYSMAGGLTFQGIKRHQVNRFLLLEEMIDSIKANRGKWAKVKGDTIEDFWSVRDYGWECVIAQTLPDTPETAVDGYVIEPFRLATTYLGLSDTQECTYEWFINFALTNLMSQVWEDYYITVYLAAETIAVGGVVKSPVTRIRLRRDMFTRHDQFGYYSFRFASSNGAGDSERLYIWSDGLIALRSLVFVCKPTTRERTAPLLTAPDFAGQEEY